jgi:hypothetical protein
MKLVELMIVENIATEQEVNDFVKQLNDPRFKPESKGGFPRHIRATQRGGKGMTKAQAEEVLGIPLKSEMGLPTQISRQFDTYSFLHNGKTYYIVTLRATVNPTSGQAVPVIRQQETAPGKGGLGLQQNYTGLSSLITDLQSKISAKYKDERGKLLLHILNNAIGYQSGKQTPLPEELQFLFSNKKNVNNVSTAFGECLAPIVFGKPNNKVEFPSANEPVVDVKLNNVSIAVKSLSGSGNSLVKMADVIDMYQDTIDQTDLKKVAQYKMIQKMSDKGRKVNDLIVELAHDIGSPEMTAFKTKTDQPVTTYPQLESALEGILMKNETPVPFDTMLKFVKEIMSAGGGKTVGIPIDILTRGPEKYKSQPVKYVALMMTYGFGIGVKNVIQKGVDKDSYSELMTDIMKNVKASAGFVDISSVGIITGKIQPFSTLKFKFDYHAYTSNPGNNRPGFVIAG